MNTFEVILTRRSIRKYKDKAVPEEDIHDLLKAAMAAPSANNRQPWHFVVIDDRKVLDEIPKFHKYADMLKDAHLAILVLGDQRLEQTEGYVIQDCSAATQNILLAAHSKGLGAVWLGIHPREERMSGMRNLLGLPEHIIPLSLIAIGHPAEKVPQVDRFDEKRIHKNKW